MATLDMTDNNPAAMRDDSGADARTCRSELLCFLQQKAHVLVFDQLVKLCSDFYRKDEVMSAQNLLEQSLSKRMTKRQGNDAIKRILEDMLKIVLDPAVELPTFFAIDLARLPPVGVEHCDVSAILNELHALRSEVRLMAQLRSEVDEVRKEITMLRQSQLATADVWPSLSDGATATGSRGIVAAVEGTEQVPTMSSYAKLATDLKESGIAPRKPRIPPVVGKSTKFTNVKSVVTKRSVDVFTSRWHPHTQVSEVTDCAKEILQGDFVDSIKCVKLKSKYEHLYSSFHVSVSVPVESMRRIIDCLMNAEAWPNGLLVKRYFPPKND